MNIWSPEPHLKTGLFFLLFVLLPLLQVTVMSGDVRGDAGSGMYLSAPVNASASAPPLYHTMNLEEGWLIQSSAKCGEKGKTLSTPGFNPEGWYPTAVPSTVLAALVKNKVYNNIYYGKNLENIPTKQFQNSWWYRKEFEVKGLPDFSTARLICEGINYRAEVWLNGRLIASGKDIAGAFRTFDLDISSLVKPGRNVLALEVSPPKDGDFTIGFVDWNPTPPDRNMGLWRGVHIRFSGPVSINHPYVRSHVKLDTLDHAALTVSMELVNHGRAPISGTVTGKIENITFQQPFSLGAGAKRNIIFNPGNYSQLNIKKPRLWWPYTMGKPELYKLETSVLLDGSPKTSDSRAVSFGIRTVSDYINKEGHRGYKINGKPVLIRGGGWVDDLLLANSREKVEAQFRYARHMNLNTIRLEGFWGSRQYLYDLADRMGIFLMPGWSCQWEWPEYVGKSPDEVDDFGAVKTPEEMELVARSLHDQVMWLRRHPSIFVWVMGSDKLPRPALEKKYDVYLDKIDPDRPRLMACKLFTSTISGPSAVKMEGPYDYVPPVYWYVNTKQGGAFGFNTETGPGPQPPPLESLKRMLPEKNLWPIDDVWNFHCGRHEFNTMNNYVAALEKRYGPARGLDDFLLKAQVTNYEAMRGMFESFAVNKPNATGVIQWMLNSAWPEMYWQLYDYYLMPNGAFYGARTACRPLTLAYNYGNRGIYVVNDTLKSHTDLSARVRVFDIQSKEIFSKTLPVTAAANQSKKVLDLPQFKDAGSVYFASFTLLGPDERVVGDNFYWLSSKPEVLDDAAAKWFYTPIKEHADFRALETLAPAEVDVSHQFGKGKVHVTLTNKGDKLAFFIYLQVLDKKNGNSILPIFWEDNYISLLPGQSKKIKGGFDVAGSMTPVFKYSGWNLKK